MEGRRGTTPVAKTTSSNPRKSSTPTRRFRRTVTFNLDQSRAEISQRFAEFLLARNAAREIELPTDLRRGVEKRDLVATFRQRHRARHACRAGADDGDSSPLRREHKLQLRLAAGKRIHKASRCPSLEDLIEAGLIAGDAGVDFVGAILLRFLHEFRIGKKRPRHRHHVRIAPRQ